MVPAARRGREGPFYRRGNNWFCSTALPSDIIVEVEGTLFHLHKFPLLSKCGKIAQILKKSQDTKGGILYTTLMEIPGGPDAFLAAAQFCYGVRVELTPKNILMVYSAADYLEMTENYEVENLLCQTEAFFHKVVLRNWKDCIQALQTSDAISKGEIHQIVNKLLTALSTMSCTDPTLFGWPMMMYGSVQSPEGSILWNGINTGVRIKSPVSDWWFEDISLLSIFLFEKLIEKMKERGMRPENLAGAIMYYARKYLPGLGRWQSGQGSKRTNLASFSISPAVVDQKVLLEHIEKLLPEKKGKSFCRFLLGLLRVAMILNIGQSCKASLERRIGMQLELATIEGLLIPSFSDSDNLYDTDCVERIIRHFSSPETSSIAQFSPSSDPALSPSSSTSIKVTKLIDTYLAEVATDVNLKPEKIRSLAEALPESLRLLDDGLYRAMDIYFKAHPWLSESEREQLCSVLNYGKLSIDACAHASENERLPLRVVLQVLFFEQLQLRRSLSRGLHILDSESNASATAANVMARGQLPQREGWVSLVRENRVLRVDMERIRSRVVDLEGEFAGIKREMQWAAGRPSRLMSPPPIVPRKLGCMQLPHSKDPRPDTGESMLPSPRNSIEQLKFAHHSRHRKSSSIY